MWSNALANWAIRAYEAFIHNNSFSVQLMNGSIVGNCNKFYFTFKIKYWVQVQIYQKFEKDQVPIPHLLN